MNVRPSKTSDTPPQLRLGSRPTARRVAPAIGVFGVGLVALFTLVVLHVTQGQSGFGFMTVVAAIFSPDNSTAHNIVRYIQLPRAVIGILTGAALGIAGVLLQGVTRNPLASPSTLGVNAGAYLALTATAVFAPGLLNLSPVLVAFAGGLCAAMLVYAIAASVQVTPTRLALAGVAVSLALAAFTAALQLFYENETAGLFFWGAGFLAQTDWSKTTYTWPQVLIGAALAMLMARPLDVLLLGDDVARSLGSRVQLTRLVGTLVGVFLAAVAVSVVGPIGFIGLIVPHLVRLMGIQPHWLLLPGAAIWGAVVLVGADFTARLVATNISELPAGSVTALIGAPFLIWLARRAGGIDRVLPRARLLRVEPLRVVGYPVLLFSAILLLLIALTAGIVLGDVSLSLTQIIQTFQGDGTPLAERIIFNLRLPRLLVAVLAGAALAVSGLLLQGVVRNPLAGPEIIGITSGAGFSALLVLILVPDAPIEVVQLTAFSGAFAALGLVYAASWQGGLAATRLALVGLAVSAFCAAGTNLLVFIAKLRVAQAIVWLSGSTYARGWDELVRLFIWPLVLLPLAQVAARWLDLMALGDDFPRSLGIQLERARVLLLTIAVALAAAAVATVGTIGFVGLIAPHAARLLVGGQYRKLVPLTAVLGAILVVVADTVGRVALAPREIPSGLVTAMIGTPYFLWLLWRSRASSTR